MNRLVRIATLIAITSLGAGTALAQGSRHGSRGDDRYRPSDRHQDRDRDRGRHDRGWRGDRGYGVAASLEAQVDRFARSFDRALDRSRLNGSRREDVLNDHAKRLERQTDKLKQQLRHRRGGRDLVDRIFREARTLDRFIARARLDRRAEQDWRSVKRDLDRLARQFRVARWQGRDDHRYDRGRDRYDRNRDRYDRGRNRHDHGRRSHG